MLPTYRAMLHGDRLEWEDDVPEQVRGDQSVAVYVTIIDQSELNEISQGQRMADALRRLAARGGPSGISDALEWQRQQREDRPLPERVR